jgi:hypothetical protein
MAAADLVSRHLSCHRKWFYVKLARNVLTTKRAKGP